MLLRAREFGRFSLWLYEAVDCRIEHHQHRRGGLSLVGQHKLTVGVEHGVGEVVRGVQSVPAAVFGGRDSKRNGLHLELLLLLRLIRRVAEVPTLL